MNDLKKLPDPPASFKEGLKQLLCQTSLWFNRKRLIENWPSFLGRFCEISVPRGIVRRRTAEPRGAANLNIILELLKRTAEVEGDLAECGVFRGATLIPMAVYLQQRGGKKTLWGLDSFEGFDQTVYQDIRLGGEKDSEKKLKGFSQTSLAYVQNKLETFGVESYVQLLPGFFHQTLPTVRNRQFSFVHLDCDLYESYKVCLDFFYERLSSGGIILLDEYNDPHWPGCNKAVDEFLSTQETHCLEIERDNFIKYYICKKEGASSRNQAKSDVF